MWYSWREPGEEYEAGRKMYFLIQLTVSSKPHCRALEGGFQHTETPQTPVSPPPHGTCPRHRLSNWTNSSMMTISMTLTLDLLVSGSWNSTLKLSLISPIFDELVVVSIVSWLLVAAGFYFTPLSKVLTLHFPVILFSGFRFLIFNISVVVIIIIVTLYL